MLDGRLISTRQDSPNRKQTRSSSGQRALPDFQNSFLSKPGHFFLKIHDSLESDMTIVQLSGVQCKSLR